MHWSHAATERPRLLPSAATLRVATEPGGQPAWLQQCGGKISVHWIVPSSRFQGDPINRQPDGGGVTLVINARPGAHQVSYTLLCQELRGELRERMVPGEAESVGCRAVAALYALLLEHPVDRRGRCSSCAWSSVVFGRRHRCRIYRVARYWLHQPRAETLVSSLASELGLSIPPPPVERPEPGWPGLTITERADPDGTDVLPRVEAESHDSGPGFSQAPAASPPLISPSGDFPRAGRPDSDHGGAGERPDRPRPRRGPPGPPSAPAMSVLVGGCVPCLV